MKNLFIILSILLIGLTSCGNVVFEESQPQGVKLRNSIPKKLHGIYQNQKDKKEYIKVNSSMVTEHTSRNNDVDTMFSISDSSFITKKSKYYYLNLVAGNSKWLVVPVYLNKGELSIWMKAKANDTCLNRDYVRKETSNSNITESREVYYFKPNRKQLLELHKEGLFGDEEKYKKVKNLL